MEGLKAYPMLLIHAGACGYILGVSFTEDELHDEVLWSDLAERVRQQILHMEERVIRWT